MLAQLWSTFARELQSISLIEIEAADALYVRPAAARRRAFSTHDAPTRDAPPSLSLPQAVRAHRS